MAKTYSSVKIPQLCTLNLLYKSGFELRNWYEIRIGSQMILFTEVMLKIEMSGLAFFTKCDFFSLPPLSHPVKQK